MSTPTLRELIAKATPGEWKRSNYRPNRIIARSPNESTYLTGDDKFPPLLESPNTAQGCADSSLAARCNPATMLAVYDALETLARYPVARTYPDGPCIEREDMNDIKRAIVLLDGGKP